jgi:Porin subfamily
MKMVKSLVLGSAAGLVALSGAQAADLPVKAKAVEYVRICSLYGAGFFYIPGTDTCIKLGGYLRVDTTFNGSIYDQPAWSGDLGQGNRYRDYFAARSRMALTVDTRTATEYGVVRTFAQGDFQFTTFNSNSTNPNSFVANAAGNSISGLLGNVGEGYVAVEYVFLQFAGFTFGKSSSAYATPWNGYPGNNTSFLLGGNDSVTGINNIQYTWQFGNGVSGSLGLDDSVAFNRTNIFNLGNGLGATGTNGSAYGGDHAPDVVGNIRVDQAWGLFQFSAAAHDVNAAYNILAPSAIGGFLVPNNLSEISGHPSDKWGGSVMAALQIKNIPTGPGDDIKMDASYAVGDTKNVIATSAGSPSFAMFGGSGRGAYNSVGFGATTDSVYLPAIFGGTGDQKLTKSYGFRGAFNHNWDPYWSSSLFGSWSAVRYSGSSTDITTAKGQYCASYILSNKLTAANTSADFTCNPDFNVSQLGVVTRWTPVKNLTFSAEAMWFHLDQKFTGVALLTPTAPKPTAFYEYKNQDTASINVRVQRNF